MKSQQWQFPLALSAIFLILTLIPTTVAKAADTEKVIVSFTGSGGANVGAAPFTPNLVRDSSGNLFGSASGGGNPNCASLYQHYCGVVFELTPTQGGGWSETALYRFQGGKDGSAAGTPVLDSAGNLYSFTNDGGTKGYGTIFELSPIGGGLWKRKVLHNFAGGAAGATPGHMISDAAGNFYGTTGQGGNTKCSLGVPPLGCGIVFKLSSNGHGGWVERVLFTFRNDNDGMLPGDLVLDGQGNLYGITAIGGPYAGAGTVFKLTPKPTGKWTKTVLYNFGVDFADGVYPYGGVTFDSAGNIYGTTTEGGDPECGSVGCGIVYELIPTPNGPWQETILHVFEAGSDGNQPWDRLVFDKNGKLYGTTLYGGGTGCFQKLGCGIVFEIAPSGNVETVIHTFGNGADGTLPYSGLTTDPAGNLYGTTYSGGDMGGGTVFQISTAN